MSQQGLFPLGGGSIQTLFLGEMSVWPDCISCRLHRRSLPVGIPVHDHGLWRKAAKQRKKEVVPPSKCMKCFYPKNNQDFSLG